MELDALNWAELKTFLAVAEAGTLLGGARSLGLAHSTVLRRLDSLEQTLGARLLTRHARGCTLTVTGETALSELRVVEQRMRSLERRVVGHDQSLSGSLRLTLVEGASFLVLPVLAELRVEHPALSFEVVQADAYLDLLRGEADLAVRLTHQPMPALIGRRHASVALAAYAHEELLQSLPENALETGPWIVLGEERSAVPQACWERTHVPPSQVWLRVNSGGLVGQAVQQGLGIGILACAVGDSNPQLVRVGAPIEDLSVDVWTLYHRDLRQAARLRTVHQRLAERIAQMRPLIEGERPRVSAEAPYPSAV